MLIPLTVIRLDCKPTSVILLCFDRTTTMVMMVLVVGDDDGGWESPKAQRSPLVLHVVFDELSGALKY